MHLQAQPLVVQWIRFECYTTCINYYELGHAFESRATTLFIFQPENILRSYLNFSTSHGRLTDLMTLLGLL